MKSILSLGVNDRFLETDSKNHRPESKEPWAGRFQLCVEERYLP